MYKSSQNSQLASTAPTTESAAKGRSKGEETRERIFQLALEYFNRNGIEYVGIRELARELGLSPGNVSYYFPTKDDLVIEITKRLSEENNKLFQQVQSDLTLSTFIALFVAAFENHYNFRCIFTSFVHLMNHYPAMRAGYIEVQRKRRAVLTKDIQGLSRLGYLKRDIPKAEVTYIVITISHFARFWVQEAEVLMSAHSRDKVIEHYAGMIAQTLQQFATAKGRIQLEPFISKVISTL